jgi:cytosine/adenosine deaminase-related metal-dependent hydrolase
MTATRFASCRYVVTMDDAGTELSNVSIVVEDGWITYVGDEPPDRSYDVTVDCADSIVIPGLINTHHHLYQTLTRGFPESAGQGLFPWLKFLYPIWEGLDEEMIHASTRAGLAELALTGCTTCADHLYVFPPGSENFIDAEIDAARSIGVRFHPTRGSMDLGQSDGGLPPDSVVQGREIILADSERLITQYHDPMPGSMVRIALAPCSPFSASPELMLETAGLARELHVRLHTHLAETLDEEKYSLKEFGVTPVELLDRVSWLEDDVWLAHCVHLRDADIERFARSHVGVAHCPTSNMLLGSGLAPVPGMLRAGVPVGLGVDGSASNDANDLRMETKQAVLSSRTRDGAGAMPVRTALRIATRGGAEVLGRDDVGSIEPGKAADLVFFDADALPLAGTAPDPVAGVVLGSLRPHAVYVHGRPIVRSYALMGADEIDIAARHRRAAARLLSRAHDLNLL